MSLFDYVGTPASTKGTTTTTNKKKSLFDYTESAPAKKVTAKIQPISSPAAHQAGLDKSFDLAQAISQAKTKDTINNISAKPGLIEAGISSERGLSLPKISSNTPETKKPYNGFLDAFIDSIQYGTGTAIQNVGQGLEWKGKDELGGKLQNIGEGISRGHLVEPISPEKENDLGLKVFLEPQYWATNITQSIPAQTALMVPAIGAGAAGALAGGPAALLTGAAAGAAASRSGESFLEAGQAFSEAKKLGYDEDTAKKIADKVFKENLKLTITDIPQIALSFAPIPQPLKNAANTVGKKALLGVGTAAAKVGGNAVQEGGEEFIQTNIQNKSMANQEHSFLDDVLRYIKPETWTPEETAAVHAGGVMGGLFGGAGVATDAVRAIKDRKEAGISTEQIKPTTPPLVETLPPVDNTPKPVAQKPIIDNLLEVISDKPVKPIKNIASETSPIATVYSKANGVPLQVIDQTSPEFYVVQNKGGQRLIVPSADVTTEAPPNLKQEAAKEPEVIQTPAEGVKTPQEKQEQAGQLNIEPELQASLPQVNNVQPVAENKPEIQPAPVEKKPTPDRKLKIQRGKHGAVDVVFPDSVHADLFSFNGRMKRSIEGKKPFDVAHEVKRIAVNLGLPEDALNRGDLPGQYKKAVMDAIKKLPEGSQYTAPTLAEYISATQPGKPAGPVQEEVKPVEEIKKENLAESHDSQVEYPPEEPEVKQDQGVQDEEANHIKVGDTISAKTERGTSIDTQYAVINANDLVASHSTELKTNKGYPQELQPRDRSRVASEAQITRIANSLEPEFLGESPKVSEGAPIVGPDMVVESGNGRVIALKRVYENGHDNAVKYKRWLEDNAEKFGLDVEAIKNMDSPVLVRIRQSEVDRPSFVKEANEQSVAAMSATEQGKSDAERITPEMMSVFYPTEDGQILNKDNQFFVREFMSKVIGPNEQGRYAASDGSFSQEGVARIRNAIFAKAYSNAETLEKLAESTDNNVKNITNAMLMAAHKMAMIRVGIEAGDFYPLDISAEIAAATNKLSQLREQGTDVSTYLDIENQDNLFGEKELSPLTKDILSVFDRYKRSSKAIAKILNDYADGVAAAGSPKQSGLWGESPPPTKAEVLDASLSRTEGNNEQKQTSLFGDETVRGQEAGKANERAVRQKGQESRTSKTDLKFKRANGYEEIRRGSNSNNAVSRITEKLLKDVSRENPNLGYPMASKAERQAWYDEWAVPQEWLDGMFKPGVPGETGSHLQPGQKRRFKTRGISENRGNLTRREQIAPVFYSPELEGISRELNLNLRPAPEAMKREAIQAANILVNVFTGRDLIPFRGRGIQGAADEDVIFINESTRDPLLYVAKHEIVHTLGTTDPEALKELMALTKEYAFNETKMWNHYKKQDYTNEEIWEEFTADVISEVMEEPGFWARVRDKAPELIKLIVDIIDNLIVKFKKAVGQKQSMLKYIRDLEEFKDKVAGVVAENLSKPKRRDLPDLRPDSEIAAKAKTGNIVLKRETKDKPPGPDTSKHVVSKADKGPIKERLRSVNKDYIGRVAGKLYGLMVDDLYKFDWFDKAAAKAQGISLKSDEKTYMLAMSSRDAAGTAQFNLTKGMTDREFNEIGPALKEVLGKIPKGHEDDVNDYMILRNSLSWMRQGKQVYSEDYGVKDYVDAIAKLQSKIQRTPPNQKDRIDALNSEIDKLMTNIKKDLVEPRMNWYEENVPGLKKAADNIVDWLNKFTETWLVKDNGLLTQEAWDKFKEVHPYYVPFQRIMTEAESMNKGGGIKRGYANQPYQTKKATGSERPIVDPIESIIEQVFRYVNTSRRNEVMQSVIHRLLWAPEELAGFAEIDINSLAKDFQDKLMEEGPEGVLDNLDEAFKPQPIFRSSKPNDVTGIWFGQKITLKINDPEFFKALTALNPAGQNMVLDVLRACTRVMKALTTGANLFFSGRNISRDLPVSYINSKNHNPFTWAIGILDSLRMVATGGKKFDEEGYYRLYQAMGKGIHSSAGATDRNVLRETKQSIMPGYWDRSKNNPISYAYKTVNAGIAGLESITSAIENIPRAAEFKRVLGSKEFADYSKKLDAASGGSEATVNFSRHGSLGYTLDGIIPYFNAAIQGLNNFSRAFAKKPIPTIAKGLFAITIPTVTLFLINHDDDDWKKMSRITKDNYFLIPAGNGNDGRTKFIKIAKSREWGVVFSDTVERSLQAFVDNDPKAFKEFKMAWLQNFVPAYRPIFAPLYDVTANSDFAGRPIVARYMENYSPELQYDETTSAFAIGMGEALNLSPKKIDYLMRSYSGFIGQMVLPAMSEGRGQGIVDRALEPAKRSFVGDPLYSNDILNDFYDRKDLLDAAESDRKLTGKKSVNYNNSQRLSFNDAATKIGDINKLIRKINADKGIPFDQKEKLVEKKKAEMLAIAKARLDRYDKLHP